MEVSITKEDAVFFLDMIGSRKSPNHIPQFNAEKPYQKILRNRDSVDYKRFVQVYSDVRNTLSEREPIL